MGIEPLDFGENNSGTRYGLKVVQAIDWSRRDCVSLCFGV